LLPGENPPLNPALLFSGESQFLRAASTIAVKGSIELASARGDESGDFNAFFCGPDSLFFLVEGPFQLDLFRIIIFGEDSYLKSRDMEEWRRFNSNEKLTIDEYGIDNLPPSSLGVYLLPQFYLDLLGEGTHDLIMISKIDGSQYQAARGSDNKSFSLKRNDSSLIASYKKAKKSGSGVFPSQIKISDESDNWSISIMIDKININPRIPTTIWEL